jgi:hypothetical protein
MRSAKLSKPLRDFLASIMTDPIRMTSQTETTISRPDLLLGRVYGNAQNLVRVAQSELFFGEQGCHFESSPRLILSDDRSWGMYYVLTKPMARQLYC